MHPETHYARSGDLYIAYQVTSAGPVDVILAPGTVSHLDLDWESPPRASFFEGLSKFCRLIRFDKRGTGLSDRPLQKVEYDPIHRLPTRHQRRRPQHQNGSASAAL